MDFSAISYRKGDSPIRRGFDIFNERGRLNSMGISTDRGYAIIIRHRFAGVTVRSLVSNPVSVPPHLSTEIQGASVVLPLSPFCQDAVPLANSDCSHGGCTGWWGGAVGYHGDLSSLDTLHPSFHLRSIPMHGDPAAGQHRPIPSQKHWSLITQLSPWIVFSTSSLTIDSPPVHNHS